MRRTILCSIFAVAVALSCGPAAEAAFKNFRRNQPRAVGGAATSIAPSSQYLFSFQPSAPASGSQCPGTAVTGADGGAITFTRATVASCTKQDGTVVALTSGQPALQADGLLLEPSTSANAAKRSDTFENATWTKNRSAVTADTTVAPDGTTTGDTITDDTATGLHGVTQAGVAGAPGSANYVHNVYLKAGTKSWVQLFVGASGFARLYDIANCAPGAGSSGYYPSAEWSTNGWCRISIGHSDALSWGSLQIAIGGTYLEAQNGYTGDGTGTMHVWRDQAELGLYATSSLPTAAAGVTRAANTATFANPLANGDTAWAVRLRAAPNHRTWLKGNINGLFLIGATLAAANTADLRVDTSGYLVFSVYDSSGTAKTWTSTLKLSDGQHDIRVTNSGGTLAAYDGVDTLAGAVTGAGTGIISTQPASVYIGSLGTGSQLSGRVMDVCVDRSATGCVSKATAALTTTSLGGGSYSNPLGYLEPEWCVRGAYAANGEIMGAGDGGTRNNWTLWADGGLFNATSWDDTGWYKVRTSATVPAGTTVRLCFVRGEQFLFIDDVPIQLSLVGDAGYLSGATDQDAGTAYVTDQPATVRVNATPCVSRSVTVCGSDAHYYAAFGDSLTMGPSVTSYPDVMDTALPSTWATYNYGLGNTSVVQMRNRWRARAMQARAWDAVSVMCCTNDMVAGTSAAATWALYEPWLREIEATGTRLIVIIASPWKWTTTGTWTLAKQTETKAFRQLQLSDCVDAGRTCIDAYAAFGGGDGGDPDVLQQAYNIAGGDNVHLNQTAHNWLADAGLSQLTY